MFRPRRASDDRSPYGNFWFEPVGTRSLSGARVSADTAMRLGAVFRCVSVLANTFPVLPFGLFKPRPDGTRAPQRDHWLYKLIAKRPNQFQNPFEWRQMCMGHIALRGNSYNRIFANARGEVTDLIPQHPDRVTIDLLKSGDYRYKIKQLDGSTIIVPRGSMWHLRGLSSDGIVGMSPLGYARETIGGALGAQDYGSQYFQNAGAPTGGWIELPSKFKDKTSRDEWTESWQNARTGENRHKTPVLENGMKFHELGIKNNEAQFLETKQASVTDICRFFGVPPHIAYDLSRSTNNNIEQQSLEFVQYTLTPIAEMWEAALEYEFLMDEQELEPEFDMRRMLRGDQAARSAFYTGMFSRGAMSPNDIRKAEGDDPFPGGDQRFVPVNMTVLTPNMQPSIASPQDDPAPSDGIPDESTPAKPKKKVPPPKGSEARLAPLSMAAAERIARREAAVVARAYKQGDESIAIVYSSHARFVAVALGIELVSAEAYCASRRATLRADLDLEDYELASRCLLERLAVEGTI